MAPQTKRRRTGTNITSSSTSTSTPKTRSSAKAGGINNNSTQSTLSFRSSKAGTSPTTKDVKEKKATTSLEAEPVQTAEIVPDTTTTAKRTDLESSDNATQAGPAAEEAEEAAAAAVTEDEDEEEIRVKEKALKISDAKIKSYWAAKERARKAPRVHQKDMPIREKILRDWDLSSRFGPSTGVTRSERWWRAHGLGMQPPLEVLNVLLQGGEKEQSAIDDLLAAPKTLDRHIAGVD